MTTAVIKGLRHANIPYQVAPYEANAQLAHLYMAKHIDAALTLDSDLAVYGVKKVIFPSEKYRTHNFKTGEMGVFDFDSCLNAPAKKPVFRFHSVYHHVSHSLTHALTRSQSINQSINQSHLLTLSHTHSLTHTGITTCISLSTMIRLVYL